MCHTENPSRALVAPLAASSLVLGRCGTETGASDDKKFSWITSGSGGSPLPTKPSTGSENNRSWLQTTDTAPGSCAGPIAAITVDEVDVPPGAQGVFSIVTDTRIDGDLEWEGQRGPLTAGGNTIGGNLQAARNSGGLSLSENRIDRRPMRERLRS